MSITDIKKFAEYTVGDSDFQRKCLFRVTLIMGNAGGILQNLVGDIEPIQYYVESTVVPQETTEIMNVDWMHSDYKLAGRTKYSEWNVTVREAQGGGNVPGGFIYQFFNVWRNLVYNRDGYIVGTSGIGVPLNEAGMGVGGHPKEYKRTIRLDLLKTTGGISKSFELKGAWPTTISGSSLDYSEGLATFNVTFAYDYFRSIG